MGNNGNYLYYSISHLTFDKPFYKGKNFRHYLQNSSWCCPCFYDLLRLYLPGEILLCIVAYSDFITNDNKKGKEEQLSIDLVRIYSYSSQLFILSSSGLYWSSERINLFAICTFVSKVIFISTAFLLII